MLTTAADLTQVDADPPRRARRHKDPRPARRPSRPADIRDDLAEIQARTPRSARLKSGSTSAIARADASLDAHVARRRCVLSEERAPSPAHRRRGEGAPSLGGRVGPCHWQRRRCPPWCGPRQAAAGRGRLASAWWRSTSCRHRRPTAYISRPPCSPGTRCRIQCQWSLGRSRRGGCTRCRSGRSDARGPMRYLARPRTVAKVAAARTSLPLAASPGCRHQAR